MVTIATESSCILSIRCHLNRWPRYSAGNRWGWQSSSTVPLRKAGDAGCKFLSCLVSNYASRSDNSVYVRTRTKTIWNVLNFKGHGRIGRAFFWINTGCKKLYRDETRLRCGVPWNQYWPLTSGFSTQQNRAHTLHEIVVLQAWQEGLTLV